MSSDVIYVRNIYDVLLEIQQLLQKWWYISQ